MGMDKKILELAAKYRDYTAENLSKMVKANHTVARKRMFVA